MRTFLLSKCYNYKRIFECHFMASNIYENEKKKTIKNIEKFVLFQIIWNLDKFIIIEKKHILRVKFKLCKHLANVARTWSLVFLLFLMYCEKRQINI